MKDIYLRTEKTQFSSRIKLSRFSGFSLLISLSLWFFIASTATAAPPSKAIDALRIDSISTIEEMAEVVKKLKTAAATAVKGNQFSYAFQKMLLSKSGECINRAASIIEEGNLSDNQKIRIGGLLNDIGILISEIEFVNRNSIMDIQAQELDKMENPGTFFLSDAWRNPHELMSLSNYWIGWQHYHSGKLLNPESPIKKEIIEKAVAAFSQSLLDAKDEGIIAKTLFGRALCFKELRENKKALANLTASKEKLGEKEDLYLRCTLEEALIRYQKGEPDRAVELLDHILAGVVDMKVPESIKLDVHRLLAKALIAHLEKYRSDAANHPEGLSTAYKDTFSKFEQLAEKNKTIGLEFYRYVKVHADSVKAFPLEALGLWGCTAIADTLFEAAKYDEAMTYYSHLAPLMSSLPNELADGVAYRSAFILCQEKNWAAALDYLEPFGKKFTGSPMMNQAIMLYYTAATNHFAVEPNEKNYSRFIDAAKLYLTECRECPNQSEAHFQMGKYYDKKGQVDKALHEYALVDIDSSNWKLAKYYRLKNIIAQLSLLISPGQDLTDQALQLYNNGNKLAAELSAPDHATDVTPLDKFQSAQLTIFQAQLLEFGSKGGASEILNLLEKIESRYPLEEPLILAVVRLRINAYQTLGKITQAKKEIAGLLVGKKITRERFVFLYELAEGIYIKTGIPREAQLKMPVGYHVTTALTIFQKLYKVSLDDSSFIKEGERILLRMAEIYKAEENQTKAMEMYKELLRKNPLSADAVYNIGEVYEKNGQWKEAFDNWRRFSDAVPVGSSQWYESRLRTAGTLVEMGRKDKACTLIKMTLSLYPGIDDENTLEKYLLMQSKACAAN
jgi:tetratricopeptide (TPR) repeat protein